LTEDGQRCSLTFVADVGQRLVAARAAREAAHLELEAAVVAAAGGLPIAEIARLSGYSRQGVYDVLRRHGFRAVEVEVPPKPQPARTRRMFMPPRDQRRKR